MKNIYFRLVLVAQIVLGALLIVQTLNGLTAIRFLAEKPVDTSTIVEALHNGTQTSAQTQRAAEIITMQRDTLSSLADSAEIASHGLEYIGAFMVIAGIFLLIGDIRANEKLRMNASDCG
ncbi:MAG TPA: hypothetical protein DCK83_12030 [Gallionellaceae bacterium]|nr:hypothetical protein [Gallionellaceae bacterium]